MDSSDNAGLSRPKRLCTNIDLRTTENKIEKPLFESDDENINYSDSGSDYLSESDSDSSSTSDIGNKMSTKPIPEFLNTITTNNTWTANEIDLFIFTFDK